MQPHNQTNHSITKNANQNFTISLSSSEYLWRIQCTDGSESNMIGSTEEMYLVVGPDIVAPTVYLEDPPNNAQDPDGNVTFKYNVSDFASDVTNCSLIINGSVNMTNLSVDKGESQNFTVNNMAITDYWWSVNCTDNYDNGGSSDDWNLTVGLDKTPPIVTLLFPTNNTLYGYTNVTFEYTVDDYASVVENCSFIVNDQINHTNTSIEEGVSQYFQLSNLKGSQYNWSINCIDDSSNEGSSSTYNLTVILLKNIIVDVLIINNTIEQGNYVNISINTTNSTANPLETNVVADLVRGNSTAIWWETTWNYRIPIEINTSNAIRSGRLIQKAINFTDILINEIEATGLSFDINSIRVIEWTRNTSIEIVSQFDAHLNYDNQTSAYGEVSWIMNGTTLLNTIRQYYVYFDVLENGVKSDSNYIKPTYLFTGSSKNINYDGSSVSADTITISSQGESLSMQFDDGDNILNQWNVDYPGAGSIWNITVNDTRLTNLDSSIVPISIYENDYFTTSETPTIETGSVITKINIPGTINSVSGSNAEINYTIWFTGEEIMIKSDFYVYFGSIENAPTALFNNLWFAYMIDNETSWENYIKHMESASKNQTHSYLTFMQDTTYNTFYASEWYSEWNTVGSINLYTENFLLNDVSATKGIITFNDNVDADGEGDGVGFNINSDQDIAFGDKYNLTTWMIFSSSPSSQRAQDLENDVENSISISQTTAEEWIDRSTGISDASGILIWDFNVNNNAAGWYSAVALAYLTSYNNGFDYSFFEITQDETVPTIFLGEPANASWSNTNDVTFYYIPSDNVNLVNCSLIIDNELNVTNSTIINNQENSFEIFLPNGNYHWTVNCSDNAGNIGTNTTTRYLSVNVGGVDVSLLAPPDGYASVSNGLNFSFNATDDLDPNLTCSLFIDNSVVPPNIIAQNASNVTITVTDVSDGLHFWNVTCWDLASNINTTDTRNFTVETQGPLITLVSPENNYWNQGLSALFVYNPYDLSGTDSCELILNGAVNDSDDSIADGVNNEFFVTNLDAGVHIWFINCTDNIGQESSSDVWTLNIDKTQPSVVLLEPGNGTSTNASSIEFNFTTTDNNDTSMLCNITFNDEVKRSNVVALSGAKISETIDDFDDNFNYWNVTCWDDAGNTNTSLTWILEGEAGPEVTLNLPDNEHSTNSENITLYYTPFDESDIANCSLIFDGAINITNSSVMNMEVNNFTVNNLDNGSHTWKVKCFDNNSFQGSSSTRTIYVDKDNPSIVLISPIDNSNKSNSTINFRYIPTDNLNKDMTCNLSINNIVKDTSIISNGSTSDILISNVSDNVNYWNVTCQDEAGNINVSPTWTINVSAPPIVTLYTPANESYYGTNDITFVYTPYDLSNIANCTLIIDDSINMTNITVDNNTENSFSVNNVEQGTHTYLINCSDEYGYDGMSEQRTFYIDTEQPSVSLLSPENDYPSTVAEIEFNFTASDNMDTIMLCELTIGGTIYLSNISAPDGNVVNVTVVAPDGYNYWNITCMDNALNVNASLSRTINVSVAPTVALGNPENDTWSTSSNAIFYYTPHDNDDVSNCSLTINNEINLTNTSITNDQENYIEIYLADGDYNWTINCTDNNGNEGGNGTSRIIKVDSVLPNITLYEPENYFNSTSTTNLINFSAVDNRDENLSCYITIDDTVNQSDIYVFNGSIAEVNLSGFFNGTYEWFVTCEDNAANTNASERRLLNILLADLTLNSFEVTINDSAPGEGENITIEAIIYNNGSGDSNDVIVKFYSNNPNFGGIEIANFTIDLAVGTSINVNASWSAVIGTRDIYVIVDPPLVTNGMIDELNETNNNGTAGLNISSWHTIVGDALGNFVLYDTANVSIFSWTVTNATTTNFFVTDADSSISWSNLTAISRDTNGDFSLNDFEEIDIILNMSSYIDSINNTFTLNNNLRDAANITIFNRNILNIPLVNSTNSTNFITGILWDANDNTNSEYDVIDKEDIVFVTQVVPKTMGAYGTYGFEIKVPAKLRDYSVSDHYSVVLYAELK